MHYIQMLFIGIRHANNIPTMQLLTTIFIEYLVKILHFSMGIPE